MQTGETDTQRDQRKVPESWSAWGEQPVPPPVALQ